MENKEFTHNGIKLAYAKSGIGQPIIFLHGNGENNTLFTQIAKQLAQENFTVFAPDTRSHGQSDTVKRLSYTDMADDVKALIDYEQIKNPILFGFSDGGITGLTLAIKYPDLLKKLIVAGVNLSPNGIVCKIRFLIGFAHFFTRSDKLKLMLKQPNITIEQLKTIQTPTTVYHAQKDIVKLSHSTAVAENVQHGKIIILENENHASYVQDNKKLYDLLKTEITEVI